MGGCFWWGNFILNLLSLKSFFLLIEQFESILLFQLNQNPESYQDNVLQQHSHQRINLNKTKQQIEFFVNSHPIY